MTPKRILLQIGASLWSATAAHTTLRPAQLKAGTLNSIRTSSKWRLVVFGEHVGHLLIELAEMIFDQAQFQRELQQAAVDGIHHDRQHLLVDVNSRDPVRH
jgi:hypothetical protein